MRKGRALLAIAVTVALLLPFPASITTPVRAADGSLSALESDTVASMDGTKVHGFATDLENLTLRYPAYRSSGSAGGLAAAQWIVDKLQLMGLSAWKEDFLFTAWDLRSKPDLVIDSDGNMTTREDRFPLPSFDCEHLSWPTPIDLTSDIVTLPLPSAASRYDIGTRPIDDQAWDAVNTTGKMLVIGREVRWNSLWEQQFLNKLDSQTPAAIIYVWSYSWTQPLEVMAISSAGGRPLGALEPYYWELGLPVGSLDVTDSQHLQAILGNGSPKGIMNILSVISTGAHSNVVAQINATSGSDAEVLVTAHYDSINGPGFCDNGAGVAGMLEIADALGSAVGRGTYAPTVNIRFIAFAAEEFGMVGSVNYLGAHLADVHEIVSVVNLDCIGSDEMRLGHLGQGSSALTSLVMDAANDLGVPVADAEMGSSDHQTFSDPSQVASMYMNYWGMTTNIGSALSVPAVMLYSYPDLYSNAWSGEKVGWIHTKNDRSDQSSPSPWITKENLTAHASVAVLSVMRLAGGSLGIVAPSVNWVPSLAIVMVMVAIAGIAFWAFARRQRH